MFKKGDWVKVWSLQSFHNGGFLNGAPAFVKQTQTGDSVILCVVRKIGGEYKVDESYEVYAKQCKLMKIKKKEDNSYQKAQNELKEYHKKIISNESIS